MFNKILVSILSLVLMVGAVGCGKGTTPPNPNTVKILLQTAITTFEAAIVITNPNWDGTKFITDAANVLNAWGVGVGWQANVTNVLLPALAADAKDIPNCNTKCQLLVGVFVSGTEAVIADLKGPTAMKSAKYQTYDAYVTDWNKVAPSNEQLEYQGF
jgi:hypothetical protein